MNYLEHTLAELCLRYPGATWFSTTTNSTSAAVARVKLGEAIVGRTFSGEQICADLAAVAQQPADERDWRESGIGELIEHILTRYHAIHRIQLPELIRLAKRVEHVHGERQDCPKGLSSHLALMLDELEQHMQKEEQILFPLLQAGSMPSPQVRSRSCNSNTRNTVTSCKPWSDSPITSRRRPLPVSPGAPSIPVSTSCGKI